MSTAAPSPSAIPSELPARASWLPCSTNSSGAISSAASPPFASAAATPWLSPSNVFESHSTVGYIEICTAGSVFAATFRSYPQKGQNLSVSAISRLHCGQEGCRLHLQFGQKLNRAPTVEPHCGQGYGSGSRIRK